MWLRIDGRPYKDKDARPHLNKRCTLKLASKENPLLAASWGSELNPATFLLLVLDFMTADKRDIFPHSLRPKACGVVALTSSTLVSSCSRPLTLSTPHSSSPRSRNPHRPSHPHPRVVSPRCRDELFEKDKILSKYSRRPLDGSIKTWIIGYDW